MNEAIEGLVGLMREQGARNNPPSVCIGKVLSVDPVEIKTGDLLLSREDLLISDILLNGYTRKIKANLSGIASGETDSTSGGSGEDSFSSHSHTISDALSYVSNGEIVFETYLKVGDSIVLMPTMDMQIYIAICKVV